MLCLQSIPQKVSVAQTIHGESFQPHKLSNKLSKFHLLDFEKRIVPVNHSQVSSIRDENIQVVLFRSLCIN